MFSDGVFAIVMTILVLETRPRMNCGSMSEQIAKQIGEPKPHTIATIPKCKPRSAQLTRSQNQAKSRKVHSMSANSTTVILTHGAWADGSSWGKHSAAGATWPAGDRRTDTIDVADRR
jgi:hypothetical protein